MSVPVVKDCRQGLASHPAAQGGEMAAPLPMAVRVTVQEAPADWESAVEVLCAAKSIRQAMGLAFSWLRLRPGY
jgi:hypothetical protein